jgi:hypothetical protein
MKSASPLVCLGIGAAIATGALFLQSQAVPPTSPNYSGAYPARKNVVNLFVQNVAIPSQQEAVIYTVPLDRWLTVTDCQASFNYSNGIPHWGEINGGSYTTRGIAGAGAQGAYGNGLIYSTPVGSQVGWVFPPGSQLVLRNPVYNQPPIGVYWCSVTGYLSRE